MRKYHYSITDRLILLVAYSLAFFLGQKCILGSWFFLSPLDKNIILLNGVTFALIYLIDAPRFIAPRDSLVNTIGAAITLLAVTSDSTNTLVLFLRNIGFSVYGLVVVTSVVSLIFNKSIEGRSRFVQIVDTIGYKICSELGRGEILFTIAIVVTSLELFGLSNQISLFTILFWIVIVLFKPIEMVLGIVRSAILYSSKNNELIGLLSRIDDPNLARVELLAPASWNNQNRILARLSDSSYKRIYPIGTVQQSNRVLGTGLLYGSTIQPNELQLDIPNNSVIEFDSNSELFDTQTILPVTGASLVGTIAENSTINTIRIETTNHCFLKYGSVVFIKSESMTVYYQIIDAVTSEEVITSNPSGKIVAVAIQLGTIVENKFSKFDWVPEMHIPVWHHEDLRSLSRYVCEHPLVIGNLPGTNIDIDIDIENAIRFHCAILGVTGTGKTEVSLDFIKQAHQMEYKVFCVDITNDYYARLSELNPKLLGLDEERASDLEEKLFGADTGEYGAGKEKIALKAFIEEIQKEVRENVARFLNEDGGNLGIFNLPQITNTKATLRATELYLSEIMKWMKDNRNQCRVLIVLEEAHTVIPETGGSGFDYDTKWVVDRISQIALQGRKYDVGLLVVSQRTALVSKSVLSQCNTYITFRLVDKTSLDFLSNVYTADVVSAIPQLKKLHSIVYGQGIRSEKPILVNIPFNQKKEDASKAIT
ncbi:DUF87 domain-containing protein [bacterium]|nr:DUF87 domain-containing protein [bacterium]